MGLIVIANGWPTAPYQWPRPLVGCYQVSGAQTILEIAQNLIRQLASTLMPALSSLALCST